MNKSEIEKRKAETKDARRYVADVITSSQTIAKPNVIYSFTLWAVNLKTDLLTKK